MSKTTNYQLTLWDYADEDFSPGRAREDLAENFTKLDTALKAEESARKSAVNTLNTALAGKAAIVVGSYTGDGQSERTISLGFTPKAVLLISEGAKMGWYDGLNGGLALPGRPVTSSMVEIVTGGFKVRVITSHVTTNSGGNFYYLAIR